MKSLKELIFVVVLTFAGEAMCDTTLSCRTTINPSRGGAITEASGDVPPSFFHFTIDPAVGSKEAWLYQNRCISRSDLKGASFKGNVCVVIFNSGPGGVGAKSEKQVLTIDVGHYLPLRSKGSLTAFTKQSTSDDTVVTLPFPSGAFAVELNGLENGLYSVRVSCEEVSTSPQ